MAILGGDLEIRGIFSRIPQIINVYNVFINLIKSECFLKTSQVFGQAAVVLVDLWFCTKCSLVHDTCVFNLYVWTKTI